MILKVRYIGGVEKTYPLTARVEIEVERRFQLALAECTHREHVYFAAWVAAGRDPAEFEQFLDRVAHAEFADDEENEPPGPTKAAESASLSS